MNSNGTVEAKIVETKNICLNKDGKIVYKNGTVEVLKYGLTKIKEAAYKGNKDIVRVVLPDDVISIGRQAFCDCSYISEFEMPGSVERIDDEAFAGCIGLSKITISESIGIIKEKAFFVCLGLTDIIIPHGVRIIKESAFSNCESLESITIPKSLESIESKAFYKCGKLADIYYCGSEAEWKWINIAKEGNEKLIGNMFKHAKIHYNSAFDAAKQGKERT